MKLCGRTLFGQKPPKGQELDDHYCGRIRIRVAEFMKQLDENLWKLGVTSITKHNEAAPCQHELAPLFAYANIATDNNQLIMETMRITAKKLGLACLLHEKPFAGVNGSGKHNNWSLATDDGYNLLDPGKTPYENMQFLIFVCAVLCAIDKHADLIRLGAANVGNEHRLGGNEAPPSIISVYLGDDLNRILNEIANGDPHQENLSNFLTTGVATLPQLPMDSSDRNRTSPIAFTGNRFEFRMVGSSDSVANANVYINTAVAESLAKIADRLENTADFDAEIKSIITDSIKKHGKVIFDGDGYSKNWELEAEKRGLPNIRTCVDAFSAIIKPENISLLERFEVLSKSECESRYDIMRENYENVILIEAKTMLEMTRRQILPACIEYLGELTKTLSSVQSSLKITNNSISKLALELSELIENIYTNIEALNSQVENLPEEKQSHAVYCRDVIFEQMNKLRVYVDRSESIVPKKYWPIPGYTELMYYV